MNDTQLTFRDRLISAKGQLLVLLRDRVLGPTIIGIAVWLLFAFEWMTSHILPPLVRGCLFTAALAGALFWIWRSWRYPKLRRLAIATGVYVIVWQWSVFMADALAWFSFRVTLANVGMFGLFLIGLAWAVWGVEKGAQHYQRIRRAAVRLGKTTKDSAVIYDAPIQTAVVAGAVVSIPPQFYPDDRTWNPVDLEAWYYGQRQKKLHQSLATVFVYTLVFFLLVMLLQSLQGCQEIYEMPSGGGEEKQKPQIVQIKKVIRKKLVFNELSKVIMRPPPIEEIQVINQEITKHLYEIGQGKGKGAGFSGGTNKGKVRFIRLEYSGGDWDQDFGLGGDLNMLLRYGIETGHKVNDRTESRTIGQLDNFPKYKSPPLVYITGQRAIGASKKEIKILREFILDKHGMVFADNGGSSQWHGQFFRLMDQVLEGEGVVPVRVPLDDRIHSIPFKLPFLPYVAPHGGKDAWGWWKDGRWVAYYHPGDIGDAWADGHAGVRREVYEACYHLGVNVIFYAHAEYNKWIEATKPKDE